jgi:RNA-directed DNA polymerase
MAAIAVAGAASRSAADWQTIDWSKAHREVRRLQARIVQATQAGCWGKVQALQRLLTHSFSAKAVAVRRVTENHGKRTPGVDGVLWDTPAKKAAAIDTLAPRGYQPRPLKRVYIPKANGKRRPLGMLTMRDRAMQALYLLALDPIAETTADPNSYGFRKERSPADAIAQCHIILSSPGRAAYVLEGDIRACFEKISHEWLLAHVPMDKAILRKWLKAGFMENQVLYPTEEGTPQGGPISPVLANWTLNGLEGWIRQAFTYTEYRRAKANVVRFADDFIITGSSRELLEEIVKPRVEQFLRERGLELSAEKTTITQIEDGFDFLGKNIRKYANGKVLTKPAKKNVQAFLGKVREVIKTHKTLDAGTLVVLLNPLIRGWANYHRHDAAKAILNAVDNAIFHSLWRWAKRRHPTKGQRWIKAKYFYSRGARNWVFSGMHNGQERNLFQASSIAVSRYVKIKGEANPYDPAWAAYFERRTGIKMAQTLAGRRQLLTLWQEQNGICPICNQPITEMTEWHNHHIIGRSNGGTDSGENRVLLHPECHRQVHNQGIYVEKPRPAKGVGEA